MSGDKTLLGLLKEKLMSKKVSFLGIILLITVVLLVVAPVIAQDGTIVYNSYHSTMDPARELDEQLVQMWNEAHPDQPLNHSIIQHEEFKQAIRAYLVSDPPPDVMTWFAGERARFFIDRDLILDFSEMWEEQGFSEVYAPGFQELARVDDGYYFLPTSYYWWAIYYRKSVVEEVGVEVPIETWDELLAACDAFTAAGKRAFAIGTRDLWTTGGWFDYLNMRINGPEFHLGLMSLQESYTDERVRDVFAHWQQLLEHQCFIDDPAAYVWNEAIPLMINGEAGMYLLGQFITGSFPEELQDDLDFFRFPVINPDVPIGEDAPTDGYFIAANAHNPQGAMDFLAFLGSQEVQQMALDQVGRLPTRTDVDLSNVDEATQKGINLIQTADYVFQFYDRDTTAEMYEAGFDAFTAFWDDPSQIDSLLEDLEADRVRIAEEQAALD
jgi:multiple sugar transport system substrate-binding protein/raffinose/stachyose/melibiose transport system substrate-binding protein